MVALVLTIVGGLETIEGLVRVRVAEFVPFFHCKVSISGYVWNPPGEVRGLDYAPIKIEIADDLSYWRAEIPGKVIAKGEALTGPMTPPGKRVQTLNPPGSEVGPGTVATWGTAVTDEVNVPEFRYEWKRSGKSSKHIAFNWTGP